MKPLTNEQWNVISAIRKQGCAVVVLTPMELRGAPSGEVETFLVERSWEIIDELSTFTPAEELALEIEDMDFSEAQ